MIVPTWGRKLTSQKQDFVDPRNPARACAVLTNPKIGSTKSFSHLVLIYYVNVE
jgi:hypothetical protein